MEVILMAAARTNFRPSLSESCPRTGEPKNSPTRKTAMATPSKKARGAGEVSAESTPCSCGWRNMGDRTGETSAPTKKPKNTRT